jgi:hypothetical protein
MAVWDWARGVGAGLLAETHQWDAGRLNYFVGWTSEAKLNAMQFSSGCKWISVLPG